MKVLEIILSLALGAYSIITGSKWKEINLTKRIFVVISLLAAITIAWNAFQDWRKEQTIEKIEATFGDINDLDGATIPLMQVGSNGATFQLENGVFNFTPFGPLIKVYVKNNRLFVSTIIRDRSGKVIAAIYENEWEMVNKDYDYNNDETAFEVVTKGDRKVDFQVELKNGIAHISGLLFNEKGSGIYFYNPSPTESAMFVITPKTQFVLPESIITTIFKYPRGKHYGDRLNSN